MFQYIKTNRCKNEESMNPLPCFGMEEDVKEVDTLQFIELKHPANIVYQQ